MTRGTRNRPASGARVGCVGERLARPQRGPRFVGPLDAVRVDVRGRRDSGRVDRLQLLGVGEDVGELSREELLLVVGQLEVGERGDALDVVGCLFSAGDVGAAGHAVFETCRKVSGVMKGLGLDGPSEGSSFGTISIAIKAVVTSASKYVDAKTGVSLREWADFVTTARTRLRLHRPTGQGCCDSHALRVFETEPSTARTFARTGGLSRMLSSRPSCGGQF